MNPLVRQKLGEVIQAHGPGLCGDPKRLRAMLADLCPGCKREVQVLANALDQRIPADLLLPWSGPWEVMAARLTARLTEECALTDEAARWAVESWGIALGKMPSPATRPLPPETVTAPPPPPPTIEDHAPTSRLKSPVAAPAAGNGLGRALLVVAPALLLIGGAFLYVTLQNRFGDSETSAPDVTYGVGFSADADTVRWENDVLVQDLFILNDHADLTNVDAQVIVGISEEKQAHEWRHPVTWLTWKKGEKKVVTVPFGDYLAYDLTGSGKRGAAIVKVNVQQRLINVKPMRLSTPFTLQFVTMAGSGELRIRRERGEEELLHVNAVLLLTRDDGSPPERKLVAWTNWNQGETKSVIVPFSRYRRIQLRGVADRDPVSVLERRAKGQQVAAREVLNEKWELDSKP